MFVQNRTSSPVACRRGDILASSTAPASRFAAVLTYTVYAIGADRTPRPIEAELPDSLKNAWQAPLWDGTSVTLVGHIRMPERGTIARRVELGVGAVTRTLVARGRRTWRRDGAGGVVASAPGAWESLRMDWDQAFGGKETVHAGRDPQTGLPAPEYESMYPLNPVGKGHFMTVGAAVDRELPRIELLEDQVEHPSRRVVPGCFAPCRPETSGMKLPLVDHPSAAGAKVTGLCSVHCAPAYLVFDWIRPGVPLRTRGMEHDVELEVPSSPTSVRLRRGSLARTGTRIRAIAIDADRATVTIVRQHLVVTTERRLPDVELIAAPRGAS